MSTTPTPHAAHHEQPPPPPRPERELRVYSHSALFYWWPVWAIGFLMAALTLIEDRVMAVVPKGTEAKADVDVEGQKAHVLIVKKGELPRDKDGQVIQPKLYMSANKNYGVLFEVVLLLTILISNVPLRGLWSVVIVLIVVLGIVILVLGGWWGDLVDEIRLIDIRINAAGYLFLSFILFIIWVVTVFIFDHRTYLIISAGQVRLCQAVGAGEEVYDTTGMTFSKQQNDLFRHWIVGLGSGDLVIHRANSPKDIDFPNVLFIGAKIKEIERMMKEREVV